MKTKSLYETWIENDFGYLEQYILTIESLLSGEVESLKDRVEEKAKKLSKEEENELFDFYSDDFWLLSKVFPNKLRLSFFVLCYSLLENRLQALCHNLQIEGKHQIALKDLKGKGIFQSQTYLKKVIGVNFPHTSSQWRDINVYRLIRNSIVHADGKLDLGNNKQLKEFVEQKTWIELDEFKKIQLVDTFYQEVIKTIREFFDKLLVVIP